MRVAFLGVALAVALSGTCASSAWAQTAAPDSWTGLYGGTHIGYGWGDADGQIEGEFEKVYDLVPDIGASAGSRARDATLDDEYSQSADGAMGGVHVGGNVQLNHIVFGIEGDYDWSDLSGSTSLVPAVSINAATQTALDNGLTSIQGSPTVRINTSIDDVASIRGRLGFATQQWLIYATAGWAFAQTDLTVASLDPAPGFPGGSFSVDKAVDGYVFGGGVEYRISRHISLRVEALHYDFGKIDYEFESEDPADNNIEEAAGQADIDLTQVRAGLTFHLN